MNIWPKALLVTTLALTPGCSSNDTSTLAKTVDTAIRTGVLVEQNAVPGTTTSNGRVLIVQTGKRPYSAIGFADMVQVTENKTVSCIYKNFPLPGQDDARTLVISQQACPDPLAKNGIAQAPKNIADAYVATTMLRYQLRRPNKPVVPLDVSTIAEIAAELNQEGHPTTVTVKTATAFELTADNSTSCWIGGNTNSSTQGGPCPKSLKD